MVPTEKSAWNWLPAGDLCKTITKGTTPPKSDILRSGKIPFLRVNNLVVGGAKTLSGDLIYVSAQANETILKRSIAFPGDVLMNIVGPPLGKLTILNDQFPEYNLNQAIVIFRGYTNKIDQNFLYYYLLSDIAQEWFEARAKKTSGQKNLTIELSKEIPIPSPPLPEQKKIAKILSTWDEAIDVAEKLLANAELQKRRLMQQFLDQTSWPLVKIGDLGTIRSAGVDKKEVEGERSVRLLNYLDVLRRDHIFADELDHRVTAPDRQIKNCDIRKGDVFFTPSSETRDDIGHSAVAMEDIPDAAYSYHIVRFRPSAEMDLAFSAYAFKSRHFYRQCYSYCEGSGQRYVISQDYFRSFSIGFPPIARQREVGRMLSNVDKIIAKHRKDVTLIRIERRALIQQLLTGKRRVTV